LYARRATAGSVIVFFLIAAGCAESPDAGQPPSAEPIIVALSSSTTLPAATTSAPSTAPTATPDDLPVDVSFEWSCDDLNDRGGGVFVSACTAGEGDDRLTGNWIVSMTFAEDDYGGRISISGVVRAYNSGGAWDAAGGAMYSAKVIDGQAVHEGILLGSGNYEGLRFVYRDVWDESTQSHTTTGTIEQAE